jgi:hypothetical protein
LSDLIEWGYSYFTIERGSRLITLPMAQRRLKIGDSR